MLSGEAMEALVCALQTASIAERAAIDTVTRMRPGWYIAQEPRTNCRAPWATGRASVAINIHI